MLGAEASAELRDRLVTELDGLGSGDAAALWAKRRLSEKNRLTASDARRVEEAFQAKLAGFGALRTRRGARSAYGGRRRASTASGALPRRRGKQSGLRPDSKLGGRRGGDPADQQGSTRAPWPCRSPAGFGTGSTSDRWPSNLAWSAAASLRCPSSPLCPKPGTWPQGQR